MKRISSNPPVPLYYTLVEKIIKMIEENELQSGSMILSERELMEKYNMSRTTVRKAIDILVNEGYLYKVQGKGTFVQNKKLEQGLIRLTSCTEELKNKGLKPGVKLLNSGIEIPRKSIASHLGLQKEEKVFQMKRVLYGDGTPINITKSHLVYRHVEGIEKYNFEKESLYNILETKYNIKITHAVRTIEAVLADARDSHLLDVSVGSPILLFNGLVYGKIQDREVPIEYFISRYRCDKFKFYIEQVR